jgi:hypothetical protein
MDIYKITMELTKLWPLHTTYLQISPGYNFGK